MRIPRFVFVPAVVLTAGCLQGQRVIKVNVDASGTIVDTLKFGEQAKSMRAAFEQMDQSSPAEKKAKKEGKYKEKATAMGEGVTFVGAESTKEGAEKVTFAFKDIGKIKIENTPGVDESESKSKEEPLTFRFAKGAGGSAVLTVVSPKPKPPDKPAEAKPKKPEEVTQQIAMMKAMMAGLRMHTMVEVNGRLVKTSSPYAAGSTVTLFEIDFDQLDEAAFKKLAESGDQPTPAQLKGLKGIKIADPETVIEFAAK